MEFKSGVTIDIEAGERLPAADDGSVGALVRLILAGIAQIETTSPCEDICLITPSRTTYASPRNSSLHVSINR